MTTSTRITSTGITSTGIRVLVTGPCATATASLIQSVAQGPVVVTDVVRDVPDAVPVDFGEHTAAVMGVGVFAPEPGLRLFLFGTPGAERGWALTAALRREVDAIAFVVDAGAAHTFSEARVALRALQVGSRVPLVVAVNHCDDPNDARTIATSLGAGPAATVVACQLIDPRSGRDVVIETLAAALEVGSDRRVA
ncbi:MAG: hypothetical protein WD225_00495 [Ilumatobacteraceae bacterium]